MSENYNITDNEEDAQQLHRLCTRRMYQIVQEGGTVDDCAQFLMLQGYHFKNITKFFTLHPLFTVDTTIKFNLQEYKDHES